MNRNYQKELDGILKNLEESKEEFANGKQLWQLKKMSKEELIETIREIDEMWNYFDRQAEFLESMAEACKSIIDLMGKENLLYINVANNLSVDCDCNANPKEPEMEDIGIYASIDPVAIDQCCYDAIINSTDKGKDSLVKRMKEKNAIHVVEQALELGLGSREYEIINLD